MREVEVSLPKTDDSRQTGTNKENQPQTSKKNSSDPSTFDSENVLSTKEYLTEKELELVYGIKPGTARNWRYLGIGPAYVRLHRRILYPRKEVDRYFRARLVRTLDVSGK